MSARVYAPSHPSHLHTSIHINGKRCEGGCEGGVKLTERVGSIDPGQSWITGDGMAARVISDANGRAMAEQARAIAAGCQPSPFFRMAADYDPDAAERAAAFQATRIAKQREFRADKLAGLHEAGRIGQGAYRAALEIRWLVEYLDGGRKPLARSQLREYLPSGGDVGGELMDVEEAERERYAPWRLWARGLPARGLPRPSDETLEDLTRMVVVLGRGVRQVADALRIDQRSAEKRLNLSLEWYAAHAGWMGQAKKGLQTRHVSVYEPSNH